MARQLALSRVDMPSLPLVCMDAARVGQVLRNLLSNAVKFAPQGSRITLQTRMRLKSARGRRAGDPVEGAMVEVAVIDEGPGIPGEELEQIFERFTQSSLTRSAAGGTGLGLAICRETPCWRTAAGSVRATDRPVAPSSWCVCRCRRLLVMQNQNLFGFF